MRIAYDRDGADRTFSQDLKIYTCLRCLLYYLWFNYLTQPGCPFKECTLKVLIHNVQLIFKFYCKRINDSQNSCFNVLYWIANASMHTWGSFIKGLCPTKLCDVQYTQFVSYRTNLRIQLLRGIISNLNNLQALLNSVSWI